MASHSSCGDVIDKKGDSQQLFPTPEGAHLWLTHSTHRRAAHPKVFALYSRRMSPRTPLGSCLVIGGAGNLGSHIVGLLLERGAAQVKTFDLTAYSGTAEAVVSVIGDITDQAALEVAMSDVHVVFHVASVIDIRPVPSPTMRRVNVAGTAAVLAACKAAKVGCLVYTSSMEVVSGCDASGAAQLLDCVDETVAVAAKHHLPYAATKAEAERLVLAADSPELRTTSIRPGYIMGAGCIGLRVEMVKAFARSGYYVTAKVPATISTVHPRNCALAHIMAAEQLDRPDVHGQSFFVRDFEDNVVEMALEAFRSTPIRPALIPLPVAYALAWVLSLLERVLIALYAVFGATRVTSEDVIDIKAVGMAWVDIVVSDARIRQVLAYAPLVSKAECMREAGAWCADFYAKLAASHRP
jgi:nucleoside-diphosphate-sugar epimerase